MKRYISALAISAALGFSGAHAAVSVIDFERDENGDRYENGLAVVDVGFATVGVPDGQRNVIIFDTLVKADAESAGGEDPDLRGPFEDFYENDEPKNLGNILVISDDKDLQVGETATPPNDYAGGGTMIFTFDQLVDLKSIDVVDTKNISFTAFDIDGVQIGDTVVFDEDIDTDVAPNMFATVDLSMFKGVNELFVTLKGSGGIDNITFYPTPVPGALPLMLGGAAALTAMGRRRRKS